MVSGLLDSSEYRCDLVGVVLIKRGTFILGFSPKSV
jgi:hypothetical protein